MTTNPLLDRRAVLAGACLGCAGVLVGCSSDDEPSAGPAEAPESSAPTQPEAPAGEAPSQSPSPEQEAGASPVVALADVPVGGAVVVETAGGPLVVTQPAAGTVEAYSAQCTHQQVTVVVNGQELICPRHGSRFTFDGEVTQGPAGTPLAKVDVAVEGDQVVSA